MARFNARFLLRALLGTAVAVAVGFLPFRAWAGTEGVLALGLAAAVALGGALVGRLPRVWLLRADRPEGPVLAAMAGIGVRMLFTAAATLVVLKVKPVPSLPFAVAVVVTYLLLLVLEVREAVAEVTRSEKAVAR
jgi:hypothetical protein